MTVGELICELIATCESLDDDVIVVDAGVVTRVSAQGGRVTLNDYCAEQEDSSDE